MKNTALIKRIITALVGIALLIGAILAGPNAFTALITLAAVVLSLEFSGLAEGAGVRPSRTILIFFSAGLPAVLVYAGATASTLWILLIIGALMSAKLFDHTRFRLADLGTTVFGVFYVGLLPSMLALAYRVELGPLPVLMIFVAVWIADTSAFIVGSLAGRTPLARKLSPNKTLEGAVGSVLVTVLIFGSFTFWLEMELIERLSFGGALAVAAMFGDLFESALKREAGVKDSGTILPGHGGLLDRVDSLLAAGPLGYFLLTIFLK